MTDEERRRTMEFILQQQARTDAKLDELAENDRKADRRLTRLENMLKMAIRAGVRERREWRERHNALVEAQMSTEEVLKRTQDQMTEGFRKLEEGLGKMGEGVGKSVENFTRLDESYRRADERLTRTEEIVRNNSESLKALELATQRNTEAIAHNSESIRTLELATRRNTEDINRLARIVERNVSGRDGGGAAEDSGRGE